MNYKIYSYYDNERQEFSPAFLGEDEVIAKRMYLQGVTKSPFWKRCDLYEIGDFDTEAFNEALKGHCPLRIKIGEDEVKEYWKELDEIQN